MTQEKKLNSTYNKAEENLLAEAEQIMPNIGGASLEDIPKKLQQACKNAGWDSLTPVQSLVIPHLLDKEDILAQSRTGSGKTGAYLLPMLELINPKLKKTQVLVLAPTRELAQQVEREAQKLFSETSISTCTVYGGVAYEPQLKALQAGAQVVIGTPGRIIDLLVRRALDCKNLCLLVFDEADRMLSIGFYKDIEEIAGYLPPKRQTALFSATYPPHVIKLASEFTQDALMLSLSKDEVHVAEVEHLYCEVQSTDKDKALVRLLETENPSSAIIFCNTKADVHYLTSVLKGFGFSADELTSDSTQRQRELVLAKVRSGKVKYLVATDVAARGIDIPDLSHVFLYTPPEDKESYIHRAGRTGRAGAAGTVISLVDVRQKMDLKRIGNFYKISLRQMKAPTDEEVAATVSTRLQALLESRLRTLTGSERKSVNRYLPLATELVKNIETNDGENLELIALLLNDYNHLRRAGDEFPRYCKNFDEGRPASQKKIKRPKPGAKRKGPALKKRRNS